MPKYGQNITKLLQYTYGKGDINYEKSYHFYVHGDIFGYFGKCKS